MTSSMIDLIRNDLGPRRMHLRLVEEVLRLAARKDSLTVANLTSDVVGTSCHGRSKKANLALLRSTLVEMVKSRG